ncbi:MAG: nucleoside diphosphate kinase regulator [Deltaproteobacteria bacterium]|nr:nucleoside diphosphate kinase regulator [Deltaproteobacteria bacterium]
MAKQDHARQLLLAQRQEDAEVPVGDASIPVGTTRARRLRAHLGAAAVVLAVHLRGDGEWVGSLTRRHLPCTLIGIMATNERPIILTESDMARLRRVIEQYGSGRNARACEALEAELDRAEVVAAGEVGCDVVTMNSRARFVDEQTGAEDEVTLVYPFEADPEVGRISILAPIGTALLGLSVGQSIDWPMPNRSTTRLRVTDVVYQPEAAGEVHG